MSSGILAGLRPIPATNMTNAVPRISVVIPTYNHGRFLDEAIQSVLSQSYTDFEIVVMDNQSTDNTEEVVSKYLKDPRVSYCRNESNLGLLGNFNKCLQHARGEYVKFLLSDDYFHPQLFEKFVAAFDAHPSVVLVTSYRETFGDLNVSLVPPLQGFQKGKRVILASLTGGRGNFIGEPTTVMLRRSRLPGLFSSSYSCLMDLNFWLRMLKDGDCFIVPEVLSYFRIHDGQVNSVKYLENALDEYTFYKRVRTHDEYGVADEVPDLDETLRSKAENCTQEALRQWRRARHGPGRQLILRSLAIGREEGVLLRSIVAVVRFPDVRRRLRSLHGLLRNGRGTLKAS